MKQLIEEAKAVGQQIEAAKAASALTGAKLREAERAVDLAYRLQLKTLAALAEFDRRIKQLEAN